MEMKKQEQKIILKAIKKTCKKDYVGITEIFLKQRILKNKIKLPLEIKISDDDRERKKNK